MTSSGAGLPSGRSPGGDQLRGNWVIRIRATGAAAGTVQATLTAVGPAASPAEVAWVLARAAQGQGYVSEAARSLITALRQAGWTVTAHIHPRHHASQRVARAAGLVPTTGTCDGETRWVSPPPRRHNPRNPAPRPMSSDAVVRVALGRPGTGAPRPYCMPHGAPPPAVKLTAVQVAGT